MRRTPILFLSMLLLAGPAVAAAPRTDANGDETSRASLQDRLRRLRRARDASFVTLEARLAPIFERMQQLVVEQRLREATSLRDELVQLGPDCAPLLVRHIDPGDAADDAARFQAEQVALALLTLASPAVTQSLLKVLESGTDDGKRNALRALASHPEPDRVAPRLREFFRANDGQLRTIALDTVVRLGGPHANALVGEALSVGDDDLIAVALSTVTELGVASVLPEIHHFLALPKSSDHVPLLLGYFRVVPAAHSTEMLTALVEIAKRRTTLTRSKVQILEMLRTLDDADEIDTTKLKRAVKPLGEAGAPDVREAALTYLARNGDKSARGSLLRDYDRRVARQKDFAKVYVSRGEILYRIGDYSKAVRDFRKANKLNGQRKQLAPYLGLARSYALMNRFKDTADALEAAPMTIGELQALADDPDFAEFKESRYRHALHLPDDE